MSDLLREIRSAQIKAGEGAVCDHLRKLGLIAEKVADVQRPLNALKIAAALHDGACPSYVRRDAAEMIRQQHAEIERLTTDLAESRRKSADLEISLQASRDVALRAYGADVCPNCDTALPKGCEGVFANDYDCMWRKI